jgi:hypothetical protein
MQFIKPDVSTICVGLAASMGAVLLAGGAAGKRYSLPNSKIMIHQPSAGFQGQASDIDIHARDVMETKQRLNGILAKHTGQTVERIKQDSDRDNFMSAEMARAYGLIDSMLEKRCSFCGKSQHEVRKLIAGPTVFICDECVELCMDIIREENKTSLVKSATAFRRRAKSARFSTIT